jgi:hypothetical protein
VLLKRVLVLCLDVVVARLDRAELVAPDAAVEDLRPPAFESKSHLPPLRTIGIGIGQSRSPSWRTALFGFFVSVTISFFSRALAANAAS